MSDEATYTLPYGSNNISFALPGVHILETLDIQQAPAMPDPGRSVREALQSPIGQAQPFGNTLKPGETVAIVVSDSFRQTRADQFLPPLMDYLNDAGVPDTSITITYATGTHRGPTEDEQREILGTDVYTRMQGRLFAHDPHDADNLVHVGTTGRGTPVTINRRVHGSDHVIATGACVLHYFGGFGGGRKAIVPGIAGVETIAHNHAMNLHPTDDQLDPNVRIATLQGNPVAEDMLEATQLTHVELMLNTVLNRDNEIAAIFCGDLVQAHEEACAFVKETFMVPLREKSDLVIAASPGTKNFVQTHKALFNAWQALKPGGRIILLAPCPEGIGGENFKKWLHLGDRAAIIAGLRRQSEINGQTALSTREKAPSAILVTEMPNDEVALLGASKAESLENALESALSDLHDAGNTDPTCILMPSAAYTVPSANS